MFFIQYKPLFVRQYKKLPKLLQEEIREKISLLQENPEHPFLKTHKLKGKLKGVYSASVNYNFRMLFEYEDKKTIVLLVLGDHDVYK